MALFAIGAFLTGTVLAEDWPQWRYDANHSACSPQELAPALYHQWIREYSPLEPAWQDPVNQHRMPYDRVYEPVVMGRIMFFGSSRNDRVTALDTRTGEEKWRFYVDGPVRLPPVAWGKNVYFVSDDGYLYCVTGLSGRQVWRFRGGPDDRKVIGNKRMISAWPARGGPVIHDGVVYFAASIWPFMGIFIHAVDAKTGKVIWTNDGLGSSFGPQAYSSSAFASVAPQGTLTVIGDKLLVPGGRTAPACLDRKTGRLLYYHLYRNKYYDIDKDQGRPNRKSQGGSHVSAIGRFFMNHRLLQTGLYDLNTGRMFKAWKMDTYPVLAGDICYFSGNPVTAYDLSKLKKTPTVRKIKRKLTPSFEWTSELLWEKRIDGIAGIIKAGKNLYIGGRHSVTALALSDGATPPIRSWGRQIDGTAARLIAADDRLFAVTLEGQFFAFGAEKKRPKKYAVPKYGGIKTTPSARIKEILKIIPVKKGYCLVYGLHDENLIEDIARLTDLHVVAVDSDASKVQALRRKFDSLGLYGTRISIHVGDPMTFQAPPYVAALTFYNGIFRGVEAAKCSQLMKAVFRSMRPYGGVAYFSTEDMAGHNEFVTFVKKACLPGAKITRSGRYTILTREGALPGSADWTHLYGDIANTVKSDDKLVRLPLGLLWFGGNSHHDVLPRHGHGPSEQVLGGRLFIQGIDCLSARDVYTGKVLWKRDFGDLGTFNIYYGDCHTSNPLDTTYNQNHIPGANTRGSNYVVTSDKIYLVIGSKCVVLEPATGKTLNILSLPQEKDKQPEWGYIGIYGDLLIAGSGFIRFSARHKFIQEQWTNYDFMSSAKLVVMNRHTGKVLWTRPAKYAFRHNTIVAGKGRLFLIDRFPDFSHFKLDSDQKPESSQPVLMALDARTGNPVWTRTKDVFGTWLGYSKEHDMLIQSGRTSMDMIPTEPSERIIVHRAHDGTVVWDKAIKHRGPCIIHGDKIYFDTSWSKGGGVYIENGAIVKREHPLTGEPVSWTYKRYGSCNTPLASEYLLTFRSGAAGYYDLQNDGGVGSFGGFKSGCTSNLVAANGVLNAPDYTRTCQCSFQNQTSLALVHMPDVEIWSYNKYKWSYKPIKRVGLNFGAPGDRKDSSGTLWLDYPSVGGPSPNISVKISPAGVKYFQHHSSYIESGDKKWVAASGVKGLTSLIITLSKKAEGVRTYTVRLHFADPDAAEAGQRVFSVSIQGKTMLQDLDIAKEAGGSRREVIKQFEGISADKDLKMTFIPKTGEPVISGVEIIQ